MVSGICYTQSGTEKRYESEKLSLPNFVNITGMQLHIQLSNSIIAYPPPPGYPDVEGFVEGTAHYMLNITVDSTGINKDIYNYLYNDISYSPPQGYKLDKNGEYTYTYNKFYKLDTFSADYGGITKYFRNEGFLISKDFKYTKLNNIYNYFDVIIELYNAALYCRCKSVSYIPGTDNGNVTLSIQVMLTNHENDIKTFTFSWVMKTGIRTSQYLPTLYDRYYSSGFITRNSWETDNEDGTKTYYIFKIDNSSMPKA